MNLDITSKEAVWLSASIGALAEVLVNPAVLPAMTQVTRDGFDKLKEREGHWPTTPQVMTLLGKILARLQVEAE